MVLSDKSRKNVAWAILVGFVLSLIWLLAYGGVLVDTIKLFFVAFVFVAIISSVIWAINELVED